MFLLYVYVFINGMAIMAVEMAASRFLAPYFGSSTLVWANIIGVIMAALAVGYALGGWLSSKYPTSRFFYSLGFIGSVLLVLIPVISGGILSPISGKILSLPFWEVLGSFLVSLLLFGVPIFFLAMLSPFAVRLASHELKLVGKSAGNLYAWSTVGSILGVYFSTFFTIPFLGVKQTIWAFAVIMMILSLIGIGKAVFSNKKILTGIVLALLFLGIPTKGESYWEGATVLEKRDSLYQHIKVVEMKDKTRYLVFNEGGGIQSMYHPTHALTGKYYDYYPMFLHSLTPHEGKLDILVIGYAGGTIGKLLHRFAPAGVELRIDGVEIDPVVTGLSKEYFAVTDDERTIFTEDGRTFLKKTEKKYDLIIADAYAQEQYIPPHIITQEFFREIAGHLSPNGLFLCNVNARDGYSPLLRAAKRTIASAFSQTGTVNTGNGVNFLMIGTEKQIDFSVEGVPTELRKFWDIAKSTISYYILDARDTLLTDDKNSIEHLTNADLWAIYTERQKGY